MTADHPRLRWFGLEPLHGSAQLRRGQTDTADLATPGVVRTLRRLCRVDYLDSTRALLVGGVEDSLTGQPIGNATISIRSDLKTLARTGTLVTIREKGAEWEIKPGPDGTFQSCTLPRGRPLEVRSLVPGRALVERRLAADSATIRELVIRHPE